MMLLRLLPALLLFSLLGACSKDGPEAMLETYAERVGNAIDEPVALDLELARRSQPAFPAKRALIHPLESAREGLIDVLDFRHCGLLLSIAERNSSLGRLAGDSQRLIYELQFLPAIRRCLEQLGGDSQTQEFRVRVHDLIALKQRNLPKLLWNAIYASPEMAQHFALNQPPLSADSDSGLMPLFNALERFALLGALPAQEAWQAPAFVKALEQDYEALYRSEFGARWLSALLALTHTLERTADALERRLARRPVCFHQRPNNQAHIIRNVFQTFYAGQLQPYLALVHRSGSRWLELHRQIIAPLPIPEGAQAYVERVLSPDAPAGLWKHYQRARERHTQGWQRLLSQCGMMPGS